MGIYKRVESETENRINKCCDTDGGNDELLTRKLFESDPKKGCELLFRRYYTNLCNHAIRFVHSKEIAEDIVGEIFAAFWQKKIYEQIETSYRSYLYKSVRHRSYNYLKTQVEKSDSLERVHQTSSGDQLPDEVLHYTELYQKVERIIQQLPPQCRRAYILKRVEGRKYHEIAAEMKLSTKAVEALVSRALVKLRQGLQEEWFILFLAGMVVQGGVVV